MFRPGWMGAAAAALTIAASVVTGSLGGAASAAGTVSAASTAGCGKAPALTNGTHTIASSGQNRTYILHLPDNYDANRPYKLIFAFHWLNGTANDVATGGADGSTWAYYGQQRLSDNSAILLAPQGIDNGWANTGGRDLTLVDDLTALIENGLCVDTSQLFALGWSYGGAMSYAVACARPTVFRAVAVLSGANLSGCNGGTQPVAYQRPFAARHLRAQQRLHGADPTGAVAGKPHAHRDQLCRVPGRLSGGVGRLRRRPHSRPGGRVHRDQRHADLDRR
jgi:poly(3-hydroxybutyrate) depolymerase